MLRHGIPHETTLVLRAVTRQTRAYRNPVTVARPLHDGDGLEFADRVWRDRRTPSFTTRRAASS